jgi:hypothetical protein
MRGAKSAPAHPIVSDEPNRIPILDKGIFTGNLFIDCHEDFFFSQQLEQMAKLNSLPLNQLPNGDRRGDFAGKIALSITCLQLSG